MTIVQTSAFQSRFLSKSGPIFPPLRSVSSLRISGVPRQCLFFLSQPPGPLNPPPPPPPQTPPHTPHPPPIGRLELSTNPQGRAVFLDNLISLVVLPSFDVVLVGPSPPLDAFLGFFLTRPPTIMIA